MRDSSDYDGFLSVILYKAPSVSTVKDHDSRITFNSAEPSLRFPTNTFLSIEKLIEQQPSSHTTIEQKQTQAQEIWTVTKHYSGVTFSDTEPPLKFPTDTFLAIETLIELQPPRLIAILIHFALLLLRGYSNRPHARERSLEGTDRHSPRSSRRTR